MFKKKKSSRSSAVQTGRTLPNRVTAYSPSHRSVELEPEAVKEERPRRRIWRRGLALILLLIIAAAVFLGAWDARNISAASQKLFGDGSIITLLRGGGLKTDSSGRVNALIAGYSADDPGHAGADLTDSILLVSMDPAAKTGYMLSVPRDLYVNIPGFGYAKINEAYVDGGMALLEKVVSQNFGVQIGYEALVDYSSVKGVVNALGGIDVTINSPDGQLYDPNRDWTTGGPLVDLTNGVHHLDGEQALDLTRARGDPTTYGQSIGFEQSDFQRTADQRLVFAAIKSKLSWKLILNPRQNSQILDAVADNVKTDVPASSARPLFGLFNSIPTSKLQSINLRDLNRTNYLTSYTTIYGQSALIPSAGIDDYSAIQTAVAGLN